MIIAIHRTEVASLRGTDPACGFSSSAQQTARERSTITCVINLKKLAPAQHHRGQLSEGERGQFRVREFFYIKCFIKVGLIKVVLVTH